MKTILLCLSFICMTSSSCRGSGYSTENILSTIKDTLYAQNLGFVSGKVYELRDEIDLEGKVCVLPECVTIKAKGGLIKNGSVVGQNTRILYNNAVFDNVKIEGSWQIPVIKTSLFKDLSYENSLRDVIALTSPKVHNKVFIHKGLYIVQTEKNSEVCLTLNSNTELILEGTIQLKPNSFTEYDILRVEGDNIEVRGNGVIIGDKLTHLSQDGEWGMGIRVQRSRNVRIKGLTVKDCWGDCIYVGRGSEKVRIEKCVLDNGRRQGVSITKASGVIINKCKISNVGGTLPEYAIDVEPNPGESTDNVVIENIEINNCKGGILVYGRGQNSRVGAVAIKNCMISGVEKNAVCVLSCDRLVLNKCKIYKQKSPLVIRCEDVDNLVFKNNSFSYSLLTTAKNTAKRIIGDNSKEPIMILRCDSTVVRNNKEME